MYQGEIADESRVIDAPVPWKDAGSEKRVLPESKPDRHRHPNHAVKTKWKGLDPLSKRYYMEYCSHLRKCVTVLANNHPHPFSATVDEYKNNLRNKWDPELQMFPNNDIGCILLSLRFDHEPS
jgi:hypothetical protein